MGLEAYHQKRDFRRTPEPKGKLSKTDQQRFVVQEHHASMLHFDFRLEMGGVLKSWSIRKGPSLDPSEKRLAVETEDHPVEYLKFEGHIPEGNYGAGEHMIWDTGRYEALGEEGALEQFEKGRLKFRLDGEKLKGTFNLVRMSGRDNQWLLIKGQDEFAEPGWTLRTLVSTNEKGGRPTGKARRTAKQSHVKVDHQSRKTGEEAGKAVPAATAFKARKLNGDLKVKAGKDTVSLTNLDKIYWPEDGYTKGDLVKYYYEVSKYILPYLEDRPLIMKRYPNGIKGPFFHQHDVEEAPDYVRTASIDVEEGHAVHYIIGDGLATLLYMTNLGAIERHPWHSRTSRLDKPDWFVFDLDPGKGVAFSSICEVALSVREVLDRLGLKGYAKTSGSRGIHVYVPIKPEYDYEEVAAFAEQVATLVARENPKLATVERSIKKRGRGVIYVDHMQNARGKSVVSPYSVRPRAGATVSAPLDWSEVERKRIAISDFTIKNMSRRLAAKGDLFRPVLSKKQDLTGALARIKELAGTSATG